MKLHVQNIQVGNLVELLRDELLDDSHQDENKTKVAKGTIMKVAAITPKVRMVKGEGYDNKPYFLNLEFPNKPHNHNRVRTNFCNVKRA